MDRIVRAVVGAGSALVARRHEYRHTHASRRLVQAVDVRVLRREEQRFGLAIADAHDRRESAAVAQNVLQRDETSELGAIRARGQHDRGVGSRGARPLHVDGRLTIGAVDSRISAGGAAAARGRMDLRERAAGVRTEAQRRTESIPVRVAGARCGVTASRGVVVRIAVFDDYDRLALARITPRKQRTQVVDRGQVRRHHRVTIGPAAGKGVRGARLVHRMRHEVVQRHHSDYRRRQRRGNPRVAHVGDVLLAVHLEIVNLGVEGLPHLPGRPGKVDHVVGIDQVDGKAVRLEPSRDLRQVPLRQSVARCELLRGQPVMVVRRFGVLEFIEVFFERLLLLGRAPQLEPQMLHWKAVSDRAAIVGHRRFWTRIAHQCHQGALVYRLGDQRAGLRYRPNNLLVTCDRCDEYRAAQEHPNPVR